MKAAAMFLSLMVSFEAFATTVCSGSSSDAPEYTVVVEIDQNSIYVGQSREGRSPEGWTYQAQSPSYDNGEMRVHGRRLRDIITHTWDLVTVKLDGSSSILNLGVEGAFMRLKWGKSIPVSCAQR